MDSNAIPAPPQSLPQSEPWLTPPGVEELAVRYLNTAQTLLGPRTSATLDANTERATRFLTAPRRLVPNWPQPPQPLAVGDGSVHCDLIEDDVPVFAAMLASLSPSERTDAERVAQEAQFWRLPVTPFRADLRPQFDAGPTTPTESPTTASQSAPQPSPLVNKVVLDLTAMWAGPLCTSLLAANGAEVVKVDPTRRPDGFRQHPALYEHLNGAKHIVDLDLHDPAHRKRFEVLVARSDLLVESFSRRVMTNFDYSPAQLQDLNPGISTLAIRAFPATSPECDWIAFGSGVHAASGLAMTTGQPVAAFGYPDALAGIKAFATAVEALAAPTAVPELVEVSLAGAIAPLVAEARDREARVEAPM